ncbi:hypothetical protein TYRP_006098 [Tyrophagus putrescentiae]|nr:hypothetical protein TYRP_006098 [Tyrophagus putrescentiae]
MAIDVLLTTFNFCSSYLEQQKQQHQQKQQQQQQQQPNSPSSSPAAATTPAVEPAGVTNWRPSSATTGATFSSVFVVFVLILDAVVIVVLTLKFKLCFGVPCFKVLQLCAN